MRHPGALLLKVMYVEAVALVLLQGLLRAPWQQAATVGLLTAVVLYAADLLLLPRTAGLYAITADFGAAFLLFWLAPRYAGLRTVGWMTASLAASALATAEFFYHRFIQERVIGQP